MWGKSNEVAGWLIRRSRSGESRFKDILEKVSRSISTSKNWTWECVCHPSYAGSINKRIKIQVGQGINISK
jgi:hypothetical protein